MFNTLQTDIDLAAIDAEIRFKIRQRQELCVYDHFDMSKVTHYILRNIQNREEYLPLHLKAIANSWVLDINDFEILRKKGGITGLLEFISKKIIWKLMKFYTFRLFSQQREYNFQISNATLILEKKYNDKLAMLEEELKKLRGSS